MMISETIKRLEEAKEGSRELDVAFAKAAGGDAEIIRTSAEKGLAWYWPKDGEDRPLPHFTTNVQDAVDAIPEGWNWGRDATGAVFLQESCWPIDAAGPRCFAAEGEPALALCIVILVILKAQGQY